MERVRVGGSLRASHSHLDVVVVVNGGVGGHAVDHAPPHCQVWMVAACRPKCVRKGSKCVRMRKGGWVCGKSDAAHATGILAMC